MEWHKLFSNKRIGKTYSQYVGKEEGRNNYQRDFDRMVFSTSFRRLQNKTQVIPFPQSDHTHNRLIHSLETSSVGRSIGMLVGTEIIKKTRSHLNK